MRLRGGGRVGVLAHELCFSVLTISGLSSEKNKRVEECHHVQGQRTNKNSCFTRYRHFFSNQDWSFIGIWAFIRINMVIRIKNSQQCLEALSQRIFYNHQNIAIRMVNIFLINHIKY